jgi:hypothetical protein
MTYGVVFAGNRLASFTCTTGCKEITTFGAFDSAYCGNALGFTGFSGDSFLAIHTDPATGLQISLTGNFGIHFDFSYIANPVSGAVLIQQETSAGVGIIRVVLVSLSSGFVTYKVQYWNGSAWVDSGCSFPIPSGNARTVDILGAYGASGNVKAYINGQAAGTSGTIASASASGAAQTRITQVEPGNALSRWSQILIKDSNTIGRKVAQRPPSGLGNYQQFASQTVANVTDNSDTTFMSDNMDGNKASFTLAALTTTPTASNKIEAVVLSARINRDTFGTQNAAFFLREESADYSLGYNMPAPALGFEGRTGIFPSDPTTGSSWTIAAANSVTLEAGIQDFT